ncbi:hypothetical protein KA478_02375 [Patescibacteria group bacterium]|nr:hypothetical protein [Patescibacteria group bacterium]
MAASNNDPLVDNTSRESPDDYEQQAASIKSCTQKCDGLKAIDKAMCVSKCMC